MAEAQNTEPSVADAEPAPRRALLLMFFLSGISALIYQVVWVRMLGLVFGVTTLAVSTVLSAFMAGLAIGSYLGGRFVDRRDDPLRLFAGLQFGIGLFGLLFPALVWLLTALYVAVYRHWQADFAVLSLLRFVFAFGLLLIPTTLMGATLPVIVRGYVRRLDRLGADVGALYSMNNWGAVLGALAAGFLLMELVGVRATGWLAALVSLSLGTAALSMHKKRAPAAEPLERAAGEANEGEGIGEDAYPRYVLPVVLAVFALEGFTSLAYEVVWTRILAALGIVITVYAYALVVATFIAGLAVGSFLISRILDRRRDLLAWLAGLELAIGAAALALLPLFLHMRDAAVAARIPQGAPLSAWAKLVSTSALWIGLALLVPTTLMGATMPLVSKIYTTSFRDLGRRIGKIGFLDTVGSIFGAFAGGFILIPLLGMQPSIVALAITNVALGLAILIVHPGLRGRWKAAVCAVVLAGTLGASAALPARVVYAPRFEMQSHVLDYEESADATVVVRRYVDGAKTLDINGVAVAGTGPSLLPSQIIQGHLPVLLYESVFGERPGRIATIGIGSAHTSWCLSRHGAPVRCIELVPAVVRAAKEHFRSVNHNVFSEPNYEVIIQDGRNYVLAAPETYDIITDDSIHPGHAGSAALYTRDFFEDARSCLGGQGMVSVWVPLYKLRADDLKMVFRGFQDVFPHTSVWFLPKLRNQHLLLVGMTSPLRIDYTRFTEGFTRPAVAGDFAAIELRNSHLLLSSLMLDEGAVREYCGEGPRHTDNRPRLEFTSARARVLRDETTGTNLAELLLYRADVTDSLIGLGELAAAAEVGQELDRQRAATDYLLQGLVADWVAQPRLAAQAARQALAVDPRSAYARELLGSAYANEAQMLYWGAGRAAQALERCEQSLRANPHNPPAAVLKAKILADEGRLQGAIDVLKEALQHDPSYVVAHVQLARLYEAAGALQQASRQVRRVLELMPGEPQAERKLRELQSRMHAPAG